MYLLEDTVNVVSSSYDIYNVCAAHERAGRREIGGILMGKQVAHDPVMQKINS